MRTFDLHRSAWTLRWLGGSDDTPPAVRSDVPATVPGCVHTDLLAAGLIDDPYLADNEPKTAWIGRSDWRYTCSFELDEAMLAADRLDLACDGLDTIATLELNGQPVGEAANMHVRHRFDIRRAAKAGRNVLAITFAAPLTYIEEQEKRRGHLPHTGHGANDPHPHNQIRKMACNFGWDWGPDLPTCGIWKSIRLEAWSAARIAAVRPLVMKATEDLASVTVHTTLEGCVTSESHPGFKLRLTWTDPRGASRTHEAAVTADHLIEHTAVIDVAQPELWWPVGHGQQALYALTVDLIDAATGEPIDTRSHRVGLRTTELVTDPDPSPVGDPIPDRQGESMVLKVNGKPIYCKGADWIPDDCFPSRITPERYRQRITQARDANMNMLRIWGGGLYEADAFYDICDELGVMVWQDFCCACACYAEEEPMRSLIEAEARDNIIRLSPHPSLVIWNGCNENIWGTFDWAPEWRALRTGEDSRTWGLGYYLELFPRLVAELDPSRPYWPASPYSGSMDRHPNANEYGNRHIWDVWHGPGQYRNYLAHYPRLATEFGFHGPPNWPAIERAIPPAHRQWDAPIMRRHNKNGGPDRDGQVQSNTRMADDFIPPTGADRFDDWLYLAQVMQARALEMGVTWFRALYPWNSGALYWQLNDCWPVASWSAIDSDGGLKPLWYASRRFFADRIVTIKPRRAVPTGSDEIGDLAVYLHNDSDQPWTGQCVLRQMLIRGEVVAEHRAAVDVPPRSLRKFKVPATMAARPDALLVAEMAGGDRGFWWFAPDKQIDYPAPRFVTQWSSDADGHTLTLRAETVLRDLCLFVDRLDPQATISDQCLTLLPGDTTTLRITSRSGMTPQQLLQPPVFNVANRFGAGSDRAGLAEAARMAGAVPPSDETGK